MVRSLTGAFNPPLKLRFTGRSALFEWGGKDVCEAHSKVKEGTMSITIFSATGDNRRPYNLRPFDPKLSDDDRLKAVAPLAANALFLYRTQARRHQVKTESMKGRNR